MRPRTTLPRTELRMRVERAPQHCLIVALGLAIAELYEPEATFRCPHCAGTGAFETSPWEWTCPGCSHSGTSYEFVDRVLRDPRALAALAEMEASS